MEQAHFIDRLISSQNGGLYVFLKYSSYIVGEAPLLTLNRLVFIFRRAFRLINNLSIFYNHSNFVNKSVVGHLCLDNKYFHIVWLNELLLSQVQLLMFGNMKHKQLSSLYHLSSNVQKYSVPPILRMQNFKTGNYFLQILSILYLIHNPWWTKLPLFPFLH